MQSTPELPDHHPVIAGYHIGEEMGRGPLGKIYRAHHEQSGQWAVLRGFARPNGVEAVSYTHLTLPTIYSV